MFSKNQLAQILCPTAAPSLILKQRESDEGELVCRIAMDMLEVWKAQHTKWKVMDGASYIVLPAKGNLMSPRDVDIVGSDQFESIPAWRIDPDRFVLDNITLFMRLWDNKDTLLLKYRETVPEVVVWASVLVTFSSQPGFSTVAAYERLVLALMQEKFDVQLSNLADYKHLADVALNAINAEREKRGAPKKITSEKLAELCEKEFAKRRTKLTVESLAGHLVSNPEVPLKLSQLKSRIKRLPDVVAKLTKSKGGRLKKLGST